MYVVSGDITNEESDVIVCPANNFLVMHGGVAASIVKKGGKCILE
jgi:O-acetyl-ADP-ribose deacetylase (regulator of RNase III)